MLDRDIALVGASLAPVLFAGCAAFLDIPEDPALVDTDEAPLAGPWSCLGEPPAAAPPAGATATIRVRTCSFVSANCEESAAVTAALCNKRDVMCANPIQSGIESTDGVLTVEVPTGGPDGTGFDGYLKLDAETAPCTNQEVFGESSAMICSLLLTCDPSQPDENCAFPIYAPGMLFFNPPVKGDILEPIVVPLTPVAAFGPILEAAGQVFDPTTGSVFIFAQDCEQQPTAGVRYEIGKYVDFATPLYVHSGVISDEASETDGSGMGGFLGVPAGFNTVTGRVAIDGNEYLVAESGVYVAPFTISYTTLRPGD